MEQNFQIVGLPNLSSLLDKPTNSANQTGEEDLIQQFSRSNHQASRLELDYTKLNIPCALCDQFHLRKTIQEVWANTAWFCSALDKQNPKIVFTRKNYEDIWAMAVRATPPLLSKWGLLNNMPDAYQYIPRAVTLIQGQPVTKAERSQMRERETRQIAEKQPTVVQPKIKTSSVPRELTQARLDDASRAMERRIKAYNAARERQEIEVLAKEKEATSAKQSLGQQNQPVQQRGEVRVDTKVLEARAKAKEIETRLQRQAQEPAEQKRQFSRQPLEEELIENFRTFEEAMDFPKHQVGLGRVRPETSMVTANRMIAGALGIKITTKTETNAHSTSPKNTPIQKTPVQNTPTQNAPIQKENFALGGIHSVTQQRMEQPILIKQLTFPRILQNNFHKQTDVQNIWRPIDQYIADLDQLNPKCNFSQKDYENIWAYGVRTISNTGEFLVRFGFVADLDQARQVIEEAAALILRTKSLKNALKKRNKTFSLFDQHRRNTTVPQGRAQAYSAGPSQVRLF